MLEKQKKVNFSKGGRDPRSKKLELVQEGKVGSKKFQQKAGIVFTEIFSPMVKLPTIRVVSNIVAAQNLHLEQPDVKATFLHGDLEVRRRLVYAAT